MMDERNFGRDAHRVSEVGLGTWQIGGSWGEIDDATADQILDAAVESGVTFFDTADVYGGGRSEERIARFLKRTGRSVFVATKLGRGANPGWPGNFTREAFRQHTEASLRRLRVESLDLTQMHCMPTEVLRDGACFDWLRELQETGKIRRWGASVESMEQALVCLEQDGISSLQIIFNLFRQKPIDALFEAARKKGVAIIVRLPLASGLLTGKFSKDTAFAADDHRNFNRDGNSFNVGETFAGIRFEKGVELAAELGDLVPDDLTLARMALRWILDFDAVTTIIPGASRPAQAHENALASDLPRLPDDLHARLREFYRTRVHEHIRGSY